MTFDIRSLFERIPFPKKHKLTVNEIAFDVQENCAMSKVATKCARYSENQIIVDKIKDLTSEKCRCYMGFAALLIQPIPITISETHLRGYGVQAAKLFRIRIALQRCISGGLTLLISIFRKARYLENTYESFDQLMSVRKQ